MKKNFLFKGVAILGAISLLANVFLPGLEVFAQTPDAGVYTFYTSSNYQFKINIGENGTIDKDATMQSNSITNEALLAGFLEIDAQYLDSTVAEIIKADDFGNVCGDVLFLKAQNGEDTYQVKGFCGKAGTNTYFKQTTYEGYSTEDTLLADTNTGVLDNMSENVTTPAWFEGITKNNYLSFKYVDENDHTKGYIVYVKKDNTKGYVYVPFVETDGYTFYTSNNNEFKININADGTINEEATIQSNKTTYQTINEALLAGFLEIDAQYLDSTVAEIIKADDFGNVCGDVLFLKAQNGEDTYQVKGFCGKAGTNTYFKQTTYEGYSTEDTLLADTNTGVLDNMSENVTTPAWFEGITKNNYLSFKYVDENDHTKGYIVYVKKDNTKGYVYVPFGYRITLGEVSNGTIASDKETASEGETVTLTATPALNYTFSSWTVKGADKTDITVTNNTFTMPAGDVTVTATFKVKTTSSGGGGGGSSSSYSCKNLPSNATANNSTKPRSNTNYSYDTDTSKVCTFQCNKGYSWNEKDSKCEKAEATTGNTTDEPKADEPKTDDNQSPLDDGLTQELHDAYDFAHENGVTTMPTAAEANMYGPLTRIGMAKMLSQYAMNVLGQKPANIVVPEFPDVTAELNEEYSNAVTLAYQLGIMGINIQEFRPYDNATRAEFGTALSRMLFSTPDGEEYEGTAQYYVNHLKKLVEEKIITNANPNLQELRGYVMIMLMRAAE